MANMQYSLKTALLSLVRLPHSPDQHPTSAAPPIHQAPCASMDPMRTFGFLRQKTPLFSGMMSKYGRVMNRYAPHPDSSATASAQSRAAKHHRREQHRVP